jgi:hypothetical protein
MTHNTTLKASKGDVAVKQLLEGAVTDELTKFLMEARLMSLLRHEFLLELVAVVTQNQPFYIVTEIMHSARFSSPFVLWDSSGFMLCAILKPVQFSAVQFSSVQFSYSSVQYSSGFMLCAILKPVLKAEQSLFAIRPHH